MRSLLTKLIWDFKIAVPFFSMFVFASLVHAEVISVYPEGTGPYGYWTSLALDSGDTPHMVYLNSSAGGDLKYVRKVDNLWTGEVIEGGLGSKGGYASIGLTSLNEPRVSYSDGFRLRYANRTASTWNKVTVDPVGGQYTSLKIDSADKAHISYFAGNKLKYAKWDGSSWSTSTVDQGGVVGMWTSLALDASQNPSISYYDSTNGDLKFAQWNGTSWSTQTVTSIGNVGQYTSLAIDSSNRPLISFMKEGTGLQFAKWNGSSWDIQNVDAGGSAYTSLIIDNEGNPRIAFGEGSSVLSLSSLSGSLWSKKTISSSYNSYPSLAWSKAGETHVTYGSYYFIYSIQSALDSPTNLTVLTRSTDTITWKWDDPSVTETGFRVLRAADLASLSGDLPANTTQWTQTGLTPNSPSQIVVQIFSTSTSRNSAPSAVFYSNAVPPADTLVNSVIGNSVSLSWSTVDNSTSTIFSAEKFAPSSSWIEFYSGKGSSATAVGLLAETNYSFRVRARNGNGIFTAYTSPVSTTTLTSAPLKPGTPSGIVLSSTSIKWEWADNSNNELGFRVLRSSDNLNLSGDLAPGTTAWTQLGLLPNSPYNVVIEVFNVLGSSKSFAPTSPRYTYSSPPSHFSVQQIFASSATFSWDPNGNPPYNTSYVLQYSYNGTNFYTHSYFVNYISSGIVNYLSSDTTYYFRLNSVNRDYNFSGFSETVSTRTPRGIPSVPGNPMVSVRTATSLIWKWSDNSTTENGFRILDNSSGVNLSGDLPANTTYWMQTGLTPATPYAVQVEVFNESGARKTTRSYYYNSEKEYTAYATPNIEIRAVDGQSIDFSWGNPDNPPTTYYDVYSSTDGVVFPDQFRTSSTQTVKTGLLSQTTYYFRAAAVALSGSIPPPSPLSSIVSTVTLPGPPLASGIPTLTSRGTDSLSWAWVDRSNNEEGFRVLRSSDGVSLSGDLAPNTTWWSQTGLAPNTESQVQIQSFNFLGNGVSGTSARSFSLANPPLNTAVISSSGSSVVLGWSPNGNTPETNYQLEQSPNGTSFAEVYLGTATTIPIQDLPDLATSYFRVKALNGNGVKSEYDNVITHFVGLQPPIAPGTPFVTARTTGSLTWSWVDKSTRENGFRILNAENGSPMSGDLPFDTILWPQTGLMPNRPSGIFVQAFNDVGESLSAPSPIAYSLARPPANTSVVSVEGKSVHLSWLENDNSTTTVYRLEKSLNGVSFTLVSTGSMTSATVSDLADATTHYFRVRAQNDDGIATAFDFVVSTFVPTATPPPPPGNPTVSNRTGQSLTWVWGDTSIKEEGFRILRNSDAYVLATLPANTTFWMQTDLTPRSKYSVQVEAFNSFGAARTNRIYSDSQELTLTNPPSGTVLSNVTPNGVTLAWSPNLNPKDTIYQCYSSKNGGTFSLLESYISTTSLVVNNLVQGTLYAFKVSARNLDYSETATDVVVSTVIPVGPPSPPRLSSYTMKRTTSTILWTWEKSVNADLYRIIRSSDNANLSGALTANTTYWLQTGLTPNSLQSLRIESSNPYGSTSTFVKDSSIPNPPNETHISAASATSITLGWSPNGNPDGTEYLPQISEDGINFKGISYYYWYNTNIVTVSDLTPDTTYYFRVNARGYNYSATSPYDETISVYLHFGPPPAPTVLHAEKSTSSIRFVWKDTPNEDGYRVLRDSDGFNLSGDLPAGSTSFLLNGLGLNEEISVNIQAFNSFGSSQEKASERTWTNPPSGTRIVGTNSSSILLAWEANKNPSDTYYRVQVGTNPLSLTGSAGFIIENTHRITGLESGTTYYLRVGSSNGDYYDPIFFDEIVSAIVPFGPPVAVLPHVDSNSSQSIAWGWQNLPNATGYRVFDSAGVQQGPDLPAGTTYWMKTGLPPFSEFKIMVESFNLYGSSRTNVVRARTQPNPVTNLAVASARPTSVKLTWSLNGNPLNVDYRVERSTWSFPDYVYYENMSWTEEGASSFVVKNLVPGTTYYFRVEGFTGNIPSTIVSTVTPVGLPAPLAKTITNQGIVWEWEKDIPETTGYRVKRTSDSTDLSGLLPASALSWLQKDLSPNAPFDVYLQAQGPFGVIDSAPTGPIHTLPNSPSGLRVTGTGLGKVSLAWTPNGNPSNTQYVVGRSVGGDNFTDSFVGLASSVTLAGFVPRTPYSFVVRALGPSGLSEASDPVMISLPDPIQFELGSGEWAIETVDSEGPQGDQGVIALDSAGAPHIFYSSGEKQDFKTAKREEGLWHFEVLVPDANIQSPLAVDVGGLDADGSDLFYLTFNNGMSLQSFTVQEKTVLGKADMPYDSFKNGTLETSINGQGLQGSSVKIRPNGDQVIVYGLNIPSSLTEDGNGYYLFYEAVQPVGTTFKPLALPGEEPKNGWEKSPIASFQIPKNPTGHMSSGVGEIDLALDAGGQSHVAYFHCKDREDNPTALGNIVYAHRVGNVWVREIVESQIATEETSISIEIDSAQTIHLLYHDNKNKRVRHAQKEGSHWKIETVEEGAFVYAFLSTAMDGLGRMHAVYLAVTDMTENAEGDEVITGALHYARFAEGHWAVQTIEAGVGIGFHPSIAADMLGNVHVSYQDNGNQDLKYASSMGKVMEVKKIVSREGGRFVFNGTRGPLTVHVPANAFDQEVTMTIGPPRFLPMEQDSKPGLVPLGVALDFNSSPFVKPMIPIVITIPYSDNDVKGIREATLVLAQFDENSGRWTPLPTRVDASNNNLTTQIEKWGTVQIMYQSIGASVSETVAYPNPLRPGRPGHEQMTFDRLPLGATLRIYTLRGERVAELNEEGSGQAHWTGRNDSNQPVASGVYFIRIAGEGGDKILKVAVQR